MLLLVKPPPPLLSLRTLPCSAWLGPSPPHTRDTRKAAQSLALQKPQLGAVGWAGSLAHQPSSNRAFAIFVEVKVGFANKE